MVLRNLLRFCALVESSLSIGKVKGNPRIASIKNIDQHHLKHILTKSHLFLHKVHTFCLNHIAELLKSQSFVAIDCRGKTPSCTILVS